MIPLETLLAFALASALLIMVPGPSVLFVVGRSIALGRRAGILSVVGNTLGTIPAIVAVAFGVGALISASLVAFTLLKLAGAAYLVWLGIQAIRHRHDHAGEAPPADASAWKLLRQGFVVGATNPKAIAFFVAVLPQFVAHEAGPAWAQMLVLGLVYQAIALMSDTIWAVAAGAARTWFARSPKRMSSLSTSGGAMMIGLGGVLAVTGAKE
ncbi:Homoserine/homoserine lactone efflux protein [Pseudoclavibacter triregionum]|nr:Homoserine/homoserine lactone efflux protein [Pseudoclavibacter triregionum]